MRKYRLDAAEVFIDWGRDTPHNAFGELACALVFKTHEGRWASLRHLLRRQGQRDAGYVQAPVIQFE